MVTETMRQLAKRDLYFLLLYVLRKKHINSPDRADEKNDWLFDRCREVQANPNGFIDLWAREHFKTSIITFGMTIKDILNDQNISVGILSFNRPTAKKFLREIKFELEGNETLKELFPDVLYQNPRKESPKWSEDEGIIVRRTTSRKEATVEAYGLVDGMPTGAHFQLLMYDDVVTKDSVTTPEMIKKVTESWELSLDLSTDGGAMRIAGTRYHMADTYKTIIDRGSAVPRIYPATHNGKPDGKPVLYSEEFLAQKRRDKGSHIFACQQLLNPVADGAAGFNVEDMQYWDNENYENLNIYVILDPANEKKKTNDYTAAWVVGLGPDKNYYIINMVRDRLGLTERTDLLFRWHRRYNPRFVVYEKYGMQSDIEHIKFVQEMKNYRFKIYPIGGGMNKNDRIRRLVGPMESHRMYFPKELWRTDYQGKREDLIKVFIEEELHFFPSSTHDDMLDGLARLEDPEFLGEFPNIGGGAGGAGYRPNRNQSGRQRKAA